MKKIIFICSLFIICTAKSQSVLAPPETDPNEVILLYRAAKNFVKDTNVTIICNVHGEFNQTPYNHTQQKQNCPKCAKKGYSKRSNEWISFIENENNIELQSVMSPEGERRIGRYKADGFHEESNTVYEFHGDFWHGNPKFYDPKDVHPLNKTEYGMLMKKTIHKEMNLRCQGYNYVCIWEHEWNEKKKDIIG